MFRKKGTADKRQLLEGVHLSTLVHGEKTLMGQFSIAKGSAIPPHSHPHEQTGFMVSGMLRFNVADEILKWKPVTAGAYQVAPSILWMHLRIRW